MFERLLDQMGEREDKRVLDVCCGYGVDAALLNYDLELDDLYLQLKHYRGAPASVDDVSMDQ